MGYQDEDVIAVENEQEEMQDFFLEFLKDAQSTAKKHIKTFFSDKTYYFGGEIGDDVLFSPKNISRVLNTDISTGVVEGYSKIENCPDVDVENSCSVLSDDIRLAMAVFNECSSRGIPKQFAAGLFLMYLEICEGIE